MTNKQLENKISQLERQLKCKVQRYDTLEDFPSEGSECPLYLDLETSTLYYWDGNSYEPIGGGGGAGDNLGNHTATENLNLDGNGINSVTSLSGGFTSLDLLSGYLYLTEDDSNIIEASANIANASLKIYGARPTLNSNDVLRKDESDAFYLNNLYYTNRAAFPGTGVVDKTYISKDNGLQWTWNGSTYIDNQGRTGVYKALLTQTGTSAPTATILTNTIGSILWSYDDTATYYGSLTGAFPSGKTFVTFNNPFFADTGIEAYRDSNNDIALIGTLDYGSTTIPMSILIEVYP